jgi:FkbM family methyltransferase
MTASVAHRPLPSIMGLARSIFGRNRIQVVREPDAEGMVELSVRLLDRTLRVWTRPNTIDADLVSMILCEDSEYRLPAQVRPDVIFDIGANIGVTALYFATLFPEAAIYCFEPLPENVAVLKRNAAANSDRIRVLPCGLSSESGTFDYFMSADARNFGGGGFDKGGRDRKHLRLPVRAVGEVLAELGVDSVDLFKIDTEGSELPILGAIPEAMRKNAQAFIGELHGRGDWEFCQLLAPTHRLRVNKPLHSGCFPFLAMRRDLK